MPVAAAACAVSLCAQTVPQGKTDDWKQQGVVYVSNSINARLHSVPVQAVHMGDGFWSTRRAVTTERSLPTMLELMEEHGWVDNFRRLGEHKNVPRKGPVYTDSDVYKWMEAASWAIASNETSPTDKQKLRAEIENLTGIITAAQDPDGYLNTYYQGDKAHLRFTEMTRSHEAYCLGHLLQAGIAYYRATGSRELLEPGIKYANYVVSEFGPDKRPFVTGHPELEMAMVELFRVTGDSRYLDFVRYIFSGVERDRLKLKDSDVKYMFSGRPFTSHTEFEGHAVRALYAANGATDYFTETGDPAYKHTLDLLWTDLTSRKMYITGGVGSRANGESFGDAYELPSMDAYAETCAAVANVMWNFRMWLLTGGAQYADVMERALYNGVNSGMSLTGNMYCYRNPLASAGDKLRNPWYDTDCCPPNIERLFEALPGYMYATGRDGVYVNLYHSSQLDWRLEDGRSIKLSQTTSYPWAGDVHVSVQPEGPSAFTLYLRWPAWAASARVDVNGQHYPIPDAQPGSFIAINRTWQPGDTVTLSLPMDAVEMAANARVSDDYGRVALQRGPLVYALEQIDQPVQSVFDISMRGNGPITTEAKKDLLGGVTELKVSGFCAEKPVIQEPLYQPFTTSANRPKRPVPLTFIPYYAIGNREPTPMEVWVPLGRQEAGTTARLDLESRARQ